MPVIEGIPGLEVTVEVEGVTAKEYDDPDDENNEPSDDEFHIVATGQVNRRRVSLAVQPKPRIVKYIEARPGSAFKFRVKRMPDFSFIGIGVYFKAFVDGFADNKGYVDLRKYRRDNFDQAVCHFTSGSRETGQQTHSFKFGNLEIVDMENPNPSELKNQMEQASKLGVLQLKCFHVKDIIPAPLNRPFCGPAPPNIQNPKLVEKALKGKAIDSVTEFNSTTSSSSYGATMVPHDPRGRPFAVFEFRYRSMNGLIQEGIVPRPPTPTPAEAVRQMGDEEVRRLAQQFLERERADAARKNEAGVESKRGIKRQGSPDVGTSPYKTRRLENGKTEVDLTDD